MLIFNYLTRVRCRKNDLQLVGATSMLLACKIDERIPPMLDDFVFVCDDAYNKDIIKAKEIEIVSNVDFDLGFPLSYRFLRRYGRVSVMAEKKKKGPPSIPQ